MPTKKQLIRRARAHRKNMPLPERVLWSRIRKKKIAGFKFRRQHILYPFIVDFYCCSEKLVVELDGEWHGSEKRREADLRRDEYLQEEHDVRMLRFINADVLHNTTRVISRIREALEEEAPAETG